MLIIYVELGHFLLIPLVVIPMPELGSVKCNSMVFSIRERNSSIKHFRNAILTSAT